MMAAMNFKDVGFQATLLICRFAGLDVKWMRLQRSQQRKVRLHKALLTAYVDSDDEYFDDDEEAALRKFPLTYLDDTGLNNVQLSSMLSAGCIATSGQASLLDLVISHLAEPLCAHGFVSDYANQTCGITRLQANDYVLEKSWRQYSWRGSEWLHNFLTEEWFWKDDAGPWHQYRYKHAIWWLNGTRWFWEVEGEPC